MPFDSRRLRVQLGCQGTEPWPTLHFCANNHSCFRFGSPCGWRSPYILCRLGSDEPCWASPEIDTPLTPVTPRVFPQDRVPIERDPEDPEVVLLRPEHLPRLRGQLQMELAQIDEIAHRKGEIESQLEELDSAEKELKKRSGGR